MAESILGKSPDYVIIFMIQCTSTTNCVSVDLYMALQPGFTSHFFSEVGPQDLGRFSIEQG